MGTRAKKQLQSASTYESDALDKLARNGLRITSPRKLVVRAMGNADRPMTAYSLRDEIIAEGGKIDVVSVYRIIATLCELGLVHRISANDGYVACTLGADHDESVQHVICGDCGKVVELMPDVPAVESAMQSAENAGFDPRAVKLEILAVCSDCKTQ